MLKAGFSPFECRLKHVHRLDKRSRAFHGIDARFFGRLQFTFEISIVRRVGGGIQSLCAAESFEFVAAIAGPLTPTEPATPAPDRMDFLHQSKPVALESDIAKNAGRLKILQVEVMD
jgi:hypothetical protein